MDHYRGSGCAGRQLHRALLSFDLTLPVSFLGLDLHQKSCFAPFYPDGVGLLHGLDVDWLRLALWFWYILQAIAGPVLFVFLSAALAGLIQRDRP
jgi:hypothetical protein